MKFGAAFLLKFFLSSAIICLGLLSSLHSAESAWSTGKSKASRVRILSQLASLSPQSYEVLLGVEFQLEPGWHVYWKNPGDVGYAPKAKWSLPESWSATSLFYPAPKELPAAGAVKLTSYGYEGQVIFPVYILGKKNPSENFPIQLNLDYLVCKEQCIPETADVSIQLPISTEEVSIHSPLLEAALKKLPAESKQFEAKWLSERELELKFNSFEPKLIAFHSPEVKGKFWKLTSIDPSKFKIEFNKAPPSDLEMLATGNDTSITGKIPVAETEWNSAFLWALLFAFLGGLILNLMPCILPVVVMKTSFLLSVRERGGAFRPSLSLTVLGIISSFLFLGLVTSLFRTFGQQVGWGFQFQNPAFVVFLVILLFIFTLNLFDVFEFKLPLSWSNKMASGSSSFLEGVFATVLATPCSAPFLGSALSYALSQTIALSLLFFFAMGTGLALPYIVFLIRPSLLQFLPRPGKWMNTVKRFLAYSLLFIILWLLYLSLQLTSPLFLILFIASLLLSFLLIKEARRIWKWVAVGLIGVGLMYGSVQWGGTKAESTSYSLADFSEEVLTEEAVFLYITADWCLTCKFNEATVIHTNWFKNLASEKSFQIRSIDWTERNDEIGEFLNKFDRVGIPFAIITKDGRYQLFPELLTKSLTQEVVEEFLEDPESKPSLP